MTRDKLKARGRKAKRILKPEILFNLSLGFVAAALLTIIFFAGNLTEVVILFAGLLGFIFVFSVLKKIYFPKKKNPKLANSLIWYWRFYAFVSFIGLCICLANGQFLFSFVFLFGFIFNFIDVVKKEPNALAGLIAAKFVKLIQK